jgi:hypothetical protein
MSAVGLLQFEQFYNDQTRDNILGYHTFLLLGTVLDFFLCNFFENFPRAGRLF